MHLKKHRFRIISFNLGDTTYYETRVKTWIGWVAFTVFYKTELIHLLSDPSQNKSIAYERINQYCQVKGYAENNIEICEICKHENKRWAL